MQVTLGTHWGLALSTVTFIYCGLEGDEPRKAFAMGTFVPLPPPSSDVTDSAGGRGDNGLSRGCASSPRTPTLTKPLSQIEKKNVFIDRMRTEGGAAFADPGGRGEGFFGNLGQPVICG